MEFEDIRYEVADGVLQITLNRPDRLNPFTGTMGRELIEAFDRADADDDVRAVIVTGEGRGFCAGADLGGRGETFDSGELKGDGDGIPRDTGGDGALRIYAPATPGRDVVPREAPGQLPRPGQRGPTRPLPRGRGARLQLIAAWTGRSAIRQACDFANRLG